MKEKFDFEKALKRLEEIASALEDTDSGLEKSLKLFEEGIRLTKLCNQKLEESERKITKLIKGETGAFKEVPAEEIPEFIAGTEGLPEEKSSDHTLEAGNSEEDEEANELF